ncbi:uncharacterized protein LOC129588394 [Paramacrobiotus metropolitanus]|uniref:uncharacterized protein LOC129588394 n=1 Tax=Paramacrobiotus metropolitanus TaxID=2943436 RepID=UPI0024457D51|nr:uncharacterized protein LOC129588394 [Paramacrobiotus metropolitanus]
MFPYKISTRNVYPYFPHCIVKNYTVDFFCYDPRNHTRSANTFITGLWDNELSFWVYRTAIDPSQPYKCCVTPPGYYIDYVSCYYVWTHDQYWEYYDSQFFLLNCATGYVMTGISKKLSPIIPTEYRIEWLQCCRLGYGAIVSLPPPIVATPKGGPVAYSANNALTAVDIPSDYAHQYRGKRSTDRPTAQHTKRHTAFAREHPLPGDGPFMQSPFLDTGRHHEDTAHEADGTSNASKPSVSDKKITEQDKSPVLMESM